MQCRKCEYLLWNLKARQCPECGEPFTPSQYEFVINSVRFCCPHCNQAYYGTGERGHLVPSAFDCVKCGNHISMDDTYVLPAEGVTERQTKVETAPWLERACVGRIKAWFKMIGYGMVLPHRLIRGVPASSSTAPAWGFSIITIALVCLIAVIPFAILIFAVSASFGSSSTRGAVAVASFLAGAAAFWIGGFVSLLVLLTVWTAVTHGVLLLTGKLNWSIGRTFHAMAYSIGCISLMAVPCFGIYFSFVPLLWWMISVMVMLTVAHDIAPWRAIVAAGTFPVIIVLGFIGLFTAGALLGSSSVQRLQTTAVQASTTSATQMSADLQTYLDDHGAYPAFGLQIIDGDRSKLTDFTMQLSLVDAGDVNIGDVTLEDLMQLPSGRLRERVQAIAEALPSDVIAHRIGDYVFVYHGITKPPQDSALWSMVLIPTDSLRFGGTPVQTIRTVRVDGVVELYDDITFTQALRDQNKRRTANGLPELPDLKSITIFSPVVRQSGKREPFPSVSEP